MPYLFKLSKRVARTRSRALILAAAAAFACEPTDPMNGPAHPSYATIDGRPTPVADLTVSAVTDTSVTLSFTEVDDGAGNPASYDVRYALTPISWGSAPSVARGNCAVPVSGSAIGARRSCTVVGLAPASSYQFQLIAFRGTLNVNAVFGALSNVASGATAGAAPASAAVLVQEGFEDASFALRGWYDNTGMATTAAQQVSGSRALEVHFLVGGKTPTWGGAARHLFKETESVYLSYWVKYSANWVGSGRSYHPHEFLFLTNENDVYSGLSFTHLTAYVEHNYQNGGIPALQLQDGANVDQSKIGVDLSSVTESRAAAGCNGNTDGYATSCYDQGDGNYTNAKIFSAGQPSFMPNPGPGYKGDWHFVEAYFKLNAIQSGKGVANGIIRYWFDGKLVIERTNVLMRTGAHASMKFNQLAIAPWIGDGSPADQTMWVDNLTIATDRVASGGGGSVPAPVASVVVTPASVSQTIGGTQQFAATLKDASGNVLTGRSVTWTSSAPAVATVSAGGLETAIAAGSATITATSEGITGAASVTMTAPVITKPGAVVDLAVAGVTDTSATLSFTEVNDGTGSPASYDVRFAVSPLSWGSAPAVARGTCATPLAGSAIGAKRTCTVLGLSRTTAYGFQLIAFRGTLNVNAVFGGLSNVATGSTAAPAPAPVASVAVTPGSVSQTTGGTQQFAATLKDATGNVLTGRTITWTSSNAAIAAVNGSGLETAVAAGSATVTATSGGITGTASVTVTAPVITKPGTVVDLAVAGVTDTSATLSFTEVNDGTGSPASYDVRFAVSPLSWGSAPAVARGTCATPLAGSAIGAKRTCTVLGLSRTTAYGFQLIAFRGTLNVNAVFGGLSNVATGSTAAPAPAPVASVAVTPGSVSQTTGGTQQFAATLKDATGNVLTGRTITWTSSNAAIAAVNGSGLETAVAAGSATVTATSGGITGTASVTVTAPVITKPGTVVDLAVAGVTDTSATLSFTEVNDGTGSPASYDVRFAVSPLSWGSAPAVTRGVCATPLAGKAIGGKRTCTVLGLSPATAYGFQLIAFRGTLNVNAVFGSLSNSASGTTATGQAQQPQPPQQPQQPQPAPSGTWPHEPSGASVIGDQGFNSLTTGDGWTIADNTSGLGSVVSDGTAPFSPTGVLQYLYPVGFTGGTGPAAEWHGLPGLSQVFVGMWWKVSNPWQGHASNVNKIAFLFPGSGGDMYIAMYGTPGGPYELKVIPQFPGLPSNWLEPNVAHVPVQLGTWHRIEWLINYNGGVVQWWLDGQLVGSYTGVPFPSGAMTEFKMSSTWGGIGGSKSEDDYYWFDHVHVSGH